MIQKPVSLILSRRAKKLTNSPDTALLLNRGQLTGSRGFVEKVADKIERRTEPRWPGKPRMREK